MPAKLERCVKEVKEKSPKVDPWAVCKTSVKASDDDMLVYPDEFKVGMKEELEHSDVTGGDKETTKKIVLAHLKEDPHYYTKLTHAMKGEEDKVSVLNPKYKSPKQPEGYKMNPKEEVETMIHLTPAKAEEEEFSLFKKKAPVKAEPFTPHDHSPGQKNYMPPLGLNVPKGKKPQSEADLPSERLSAAEAIMKGEEEYKKELGAPSMKTAVKPPKDVIGKPLGNTFTEGKITPLKVKAEEQPDKKLPKIIPGKAAPKTRSYLEEQGLLQKAEEEDHNEDDMNELFSFLTWLVDRGQKPTSQNYAQYNVEKFSEQAAVEIPKRSSGKQIESWIQSVGKSAKKGETKKAEEQGEMEKPARFTAEPKDEKCPK